jgi:hypothetical protein
LFLLGYRSVLRETHACLEAAYKLQIAYQQRVAAGLSPPNEPDDAGMTATAWLCNAYACYQYKRRYDKAYLDSTFGALIHKQVRLEHCPPSIAVSSVFSLDDEPWPDDVARIVLNIFPIDGEVRVIFSYLEQDAAVTSTYLQRLLSASGEYQRYLISKLVLQHCDNVAISPVFLDHLPAMAKQKILEFFCSTIFHNRHDYDDKHLYLFWEQTPGGPIGKASTQS